MLYKNLPKAVGLRRITLHKSISCDREVVYLLLVECSHFMDHIGEAANLLPVLRYNILSFYDSPEGNFYIGTHQVHSTYSWAGFDYRNMNG